MLYLILLFNNSQTFVSVMIAKIEAQNVRDIKRKTNTMPRSICYINSDDIIRWTEKTDDLYQKQIHAFMFFVCSSL